jgi:hypothetical protein
MPLPEVCIATLQKASGACIKVPNQEYLAVSKAWLQLLLEGNPGVWQAKPVVHIAALRGHVAGTYV